MRFKPIWNWCLGLNNKNLLGLLKRNRSLALIDGVCLGFGFVFIIYGILLPLGVRDQTINGLLAVILGMVMSTIGGVMEVYHWAKLPLTSERAGMHAREQDMESKRWFGLVLRCKDCGERTGHVLTESVDRETGETEKTYECMQCGETKRIMSLIAESALAQ